MTTRFSGFLAAMIAAVFLAGCGGGGGGSSTPAASTLSGVAAVGTPIAGGTINVVCAAGSALTTTTSTTGAWQVTLSGQTLPCAVEVSSGTINGASNPESYHSIAIAAGVVNVTPLTDLVVANMVGTATPSVWFAGLSAAPTPLTAITQAQETSALTKLGTALSGLSPLGTNNPITTTFTPTSGNVSDDMLTALATAMTNAGVSYPSLLSNASTPAFTAPATGFGTALATAYMGTTSGANSHTIGGTVSGLSGSVVLQDNSGDNLTVAANGTFTFPTKIASGSHYNVTTLTQPNGQTCTVSSGAGTVSTGNVTNVSVVCATDTYSVGGSASGLSGSVVLQDNNGDNLTVATNGAFTFPTKVANGSHYSVTVLTHPASQSCSVASGTGTIAQANIGNVVVTCAANSYTIGGTVTGLNGSVVLQNSGGNNDTISTNGSFTFPATVAYGNTFNVTVITQPQGQSCVVTGGSGTATASVASVAVNCTTTSTGTLPSDNSDCSTFYVPGRVMTIDSSMSIPGNPTLTSTIVRSFGADTTFLGQSVQQVIDQNVATPTVTTSMYIQNLSTEWIELGSTSTWSGGSSTVTYQPAIHTAKQWAIGQTGTYSGQLVMVGGDPTLNTTVQLTTTLVRRESVTVPAGTFDACLFHTDSTSSNVAGTAQASSDTWIAPNVGEVKMVNTSGTVTNTHVLRQVQ